MTTITLRQARFPQDDATIRVLLLGYIAYLCDAMPDDAAAITAKYDPARIDAMLAGFATLHAPPNGALLVAWQGDTALGCGMMREFEPCIAEVQRLFITPAARGCGLGRRLTLALMDAARAAGHHTIRLDTARPLTGAMALYKALGFAERPPYHALTPQMDHFIVYFERAL